MVVATLCPCGMAGYLTPTSAMPYPTARSHCIGAAVMEKDSVDFPMLQKQSCVQSPHSRKTKLKSAVLRSAVSVSHVSVGKVVFHM